MATTNLISRFRECFRGLASAGLLSFWMNVKPVPASRPRVTRWNGAYYGKTYDQFRAAAQPKANAFPGTPTDQPIVLFMEVIAEKPKTGKLDSPRGDIDNFAKGPLDVMTKAGKFWADDAQIVGLIAFKRYAAKGEEPGVALEWFPAGEVE